MKLSSFFKDKSYFMIIYILMSLIIFLMLLAFKVNMSLVIAIFIVILISFLLIILVDYFRKKNFYNKLFRNIENLDQAYLVLEMLDKPEFYEGKLLYQALYEINKSMIENVNVYKNSINDFKDYIEMWIHEIKLPIASLILIMHNHKNEINRKVYEQVNRIEILVEQILYYVRSENAEKDYLIKEISLKDVIHNVALKNKDSFLEQNIDLEVNILDLKVYTDSKWLEFIINQIINNSIKYKKDNNSYIKISTLDEKDRVVISIYDNGIGIPNSDMGRVFDKTFTGENGRIRNKSTGMGLFIVKSLCEKLGHKIEIESKKDEYTRVNIIISKSGFYDVSKL